uniref:aggregation-promoting factor C-terminal-like domain-containing protein n=1 Tax=Streptomyces sp. WZ-12 TaxID=3030210 RepID=UPI003158AF62
MAGNSGDINVGKGYVEVAPILNQKAMDAFASRVTKSLGAIGREGGKSFSASFAESLGKTDMAALGTRIGRSLSRGIVEGTAAAREALGSFNEAIERLSPTMGRLAVEVERTKQAEIGLAAAQERSAAATKEAATASKNLFTARMNLVRSENEQTLAESRLQRTLVANESAQERRAAAEAALQRQQLLSNRATDQSVSSMGRASTATSHLHNETTRLGNAIGGAGRGITHFVSGPLVAIGAGVLDVAVKFGDLRNRTIAAIEAFKGAKAANEMVDTIDQLSKKLPVSVDDMYRLARILSSIKTNVAPVTDEIHAMSNAIAAHHLTQSQANRAMIQFEHMLMGVAINSKELNTLTMDGIPAWDLLSRATGKNTDELKKMAATGGLLSKDVMPKLIKFLQTDKTYTDSAAAASESLQGQWILLKNTFKTGLVGPEVQGQVKGLAGSVGNLNSALENAFPVLIQFSGFVVDKSAAALRAVAKLGEEFGRLPPSVQTSIGKVMTAVALLGPGLVVIGKVTKGVGELKAMATALGSTQLVGRLRATAAGMTLLSAAEDEAAVSATALDVAMAPISAPVLAIAAGVAALAAGFAFAYDKSKPLRDAFSALGHALGSIGTAVSGNPDGTGNGGIKGAFSAFSDELYTDLKPIIDEVAGAIQGLANFIERHDHVIGASVASTVRIIVAALRVSWDWTKALGNVFMGLYYILTFQFGKAGKSFSAAWSNIADSFKVSTDAMARSTGDLIQAAKLDGIENKAQDNLKKYLHVVQTGGDAVLKTWKSNMRKMQDSESNAAWNMNVDMGSKLDGIFHAVLKNGGKITAEQSKQWKDTLAKVNQHGDAATKAMATHLDQWMKNISQATTETQRKIQLAAFGMGDAIKAVAANMKGVSFDKLTTDINKYGDQLTKAGLNTQQVIGTLISLESHGLNTKEAVGNLATQMSRLKEVGENPGLEQTISQVRGMTSQSQAAKVASHELGDTMGGFVVEAMKKGSGALLSLRGDLALMGDKTRITSKEAGAAFDEMGFKGKVSASGIAGAFDKYMKQLPNSVSKGTVKSLSTAETNLEDLYNEFVQNGGKVNKNWQGTWSKNLSVLRKSKDPHMRAMADLWSGMKSQFKPSEANSKLDSALRSLPKTIDKNHDSIVNAMEKLGSAAGDAFSDAISRAIKKATSGLGNIFDPLHIGGLFGSGSSGKKAKVKHYASGGIVPGYSPGRDTVPAVLSPGEAVLRPEAVRLLGAGNILALNKAAQGGSTGDASKQGIPNTAESLKQAAEKSNQVWLQQMKPVFDKIDTYFTVTMVAAEKEYVTQNKSNWDRISLDIQTSWAAKIKPSLQAIGRYLAVDLTNSEKRFQASNTTVWAGVTSTVAASWSKLNGSFSSIERGVRGVQSQFQSSASAIKSAWGNAMSFVTSSTRSAVNGPYNGGAVAMLGQMAKLAGTGNPLKPVHFATGGVVPGYAPGVDTVPAVLSPGEGILRPEVVRALGAETIHAWNAAARSGGNMFANGGVVGEKAPLSLTVDGGGWVNQHKNDPYKGYSDALTAGWKAVINPALDKISAAFGTVGHIQKGMFAKTQPMASKWAQYIDAHTALAATQSAKNAIAVERSRSESGSASWYNLCEMNAETAWGLSGLYPSAAAAYRASGATRGDKNIPPGAAVYWPNIGGAFGHIALADTTPGYVWSNDVLRRGCIDRVPISAIEQGWGAGVGYWAPRIGSHTINVMGGGSGGGHFNPWPGSLVTPDGVLPYTGGGGVHASPAKAKGIAVAMLKSLGWDSQFSALEQMWTNESGWRWNATNPSSGAYGIPQSLPGSKMASAGSDWRDNAATQIQWGLSYIKERYGDPAKAWRFWQANHWYEKGTKSARPGLALVGERGPELVSFKGGERVYNNSETEQMLGGRGGTTITINAAPDVPTEQSLMRAMDRAAMMHGMLWG